MEKINNLRDKIHENALIKGVWKGDLGDNHYIMMVVAEIAKAIEADRIDKNARIEGFIDEIQEATKEDAEKVVDKAFKRNIKGSVADRLANAVISLLDLAGARDIDLSEIDSMERFLPILDGISPKSILTIDLHKATNALFVSDTLESKIYNAIGLIEITAYTHGINLQWYIEQKIRYNKNRPYKHGKKY